jgi:dipeptidyl aminopeptidase/acylaminoacyl peptidase
MKTQPLPGVRVAARSQHHHPRRPQPGRTDNLALRWRALLIAVAVAIGLLMAPVPASQAHTCIPDPSIGVTGRLVVPRASGMAVIDLGDRQPQPRPVLPSRGVATGVARSTDGSLFAVPRFWRPPDHQVGGQDILIVGPDGGQPVAALERQQQGEALGSPAWLPDGSLVYDRKILSGSNEVVRIERARPGEPPQLIADGASSPGVSPDGALLALVRFSGTDTLRVRPLAGGDERVVADRPHFLSIAFPRFSPDGAWIAFSAASDPLLVEEGSGASGPDAIFRSTAPAQNSSSTASHSVSRVTTPTDTWRLPLLGAMPGARSLLGSGVARAHGVPWDIWVVRPDGSDLRQVTRFADDDSSLAWSPDGRYIATFSAEAIHVAALDGAETYCVSTDGGYGAIEWLP